MSKSELDSKEIKEIKIKSRNSNDPAGALILLLSGVALLLNNFGILSWEFWNSLFRFWPVLVILLGVRMFLSGSYFGNLVSSIVEVVIVVFVFTYSVSSVNLKFDRWLLNNYPQWKEIKKVIPSAKRNQRIFRCDPFDNTCNFYFQQ